MGVVVWRRKELKEMGVDFIKIYSHMEFLNSKNKNIKKNYKK